MTHCCILLALLALAAVAYYVYQRFFGPVVLIPISLPLGLADFTVLNNYEVLGVTHATPTASTADACKALCFADPKCNAYMYNQGNKVMPKNKCWLKHVTGVHNHLVPLNGVVTGYLPSAVAPLGM